MSGAKEEASAEEYSFHWIEPGPDNPFGIRVLDCRSLTQTVTSATKDPDVASRYSALRESDGRDLKDKVITDSVRISASLQFPHNGARLEGVVFKAPEMEVKWDIYVYDSKFLFARSWTGELRYRAFADISESAITISQIECTRTDATVAASDVYFLLGTHAMRQVLPHQLPADISSDPMEIALATFSRFGSYGCYATFEDVTAIPLTRPGAV